MAKLPGTPLSTGVGRDEFVGTFILSTAVKSTAVAAVLHRAIAGQPPDSSTVSLAIAIVLVGLVIMNSGCHFNPGLTLGAAFAKQISWGEVPRRWLFQFVGAITSSLVIWLFYGSAGRNQAHLGASLPAAYSTLVQVFAVELAGSLLFYFVTLRLAPVDSLPVVTKALGIGFMLGIAVLIAGPISGGAVNPAIGLAPMLVSLTFSGLPAYICAPLIAGVLAGLATRKNTQEQQALPSYNRRSR